ncbi:MAG: hypothetical protein KTR16_04930 [Acidiferrobacterales bacterium]|nr:hypothetical protein [Acidiferrobacterales bacterium]
MRKFLNSLSVLLLIFYANSAIAQNKVVVIPMFDEVKPLANIITVSPKNGDFTNPIAAMASITNASAGNPYLIIIGPGIYTLGQPLELKPFVSVTGSGRKTTILEAGYGATTREDASIIKAIGFPSEGTLSSLTINQYGFGAQTSGVIYLHSNSLEITDVDINASSVGSDNYGIYVNGGVPIIKDLNINVNSAQNTNYGVYLDNGTQAKLSDIEILVNDGVFNVGVYANSANAQLNSINSIARDSSGTSWGIYNNSGAVMTAKSGLFRGSTHGCFVSSDSYALFYYATVTNGCSVISGGNARCLYSTNGSIAEITYGCDPTF